MNSGMDSREDSPDRDDRNRDRDRSRRGDRPSRFSGGGAGGGFRDRSPIRDRSRKAPSDRRVYVSNIAYEYRWQELKDLFRNEVGEVSFVELFVDENDKPRGCGIIEFESKELAQKAVEKMHRYELKGRKLVVKEDFDVERDKQGRPLSGRSLNNRENDRSGGGGGGGGRLRDVDRGINSSSQFKWGNTFGLSPQFLDSLSITSPLVTRVFVANLDYKVDEKKLKDVFKLAGRVINCEINLDKEGKSRGFGVVEYEHPVEAVQAISMLHGQMLYDRRLSVRMDRVEKHDGLPAKLPEGLKSIGMGLGAGGTPLHDVSRNLPCLSSVQPAVNISGAVTAPSLATAALVDMMPNLNTAGGLGLGVGGDLGLGGGNFGNSSLGGLGANPFVSQLGGVGGQNNFLGNSGAGLGNSLGGGRDFDSLSAALGGGYNANNIDREFRGPPSNNNAGNGRDHNMSDTIIIKNLPPSVTWQQLRDKFREVGDVKFAEVRGKDIGVVQFGSKWDAERGISHADRMRWEGRTLDVRYY
uniref:RRM domain-containing protein n=1 Tax=Clastoptera arizonana TaxID=38151 RepID=A0A1B6D7G4_9HEMI